MNAKLALLLASFAAVAVQARGPTRSDEGGAAPSGRLRVERGLESWRGVHGPEWRARYDERVQAARFVFGGSARAPVVPQLDEDYVALARYFLRASLDLHAIEPATLVPDRVVFLPLGLAGSTDKITVRFRQQVAGVPVIQGWVSVLFALDGTLLSIDSTALPAANGVATVPAYAPDAAAERARARFRADSGLVPTRVTPPELFIDQVAVGKHLEPRLVWEVESHWSVPGTQPEGWIYRFDAIDGALVSRTSAIHTFDVSGNVKSMATPGHAPDTAANPEQAIDMPHLRVSSSQGSATTDANGNFTIAGATAPLNVTVSYDGTWAALTNVAQTDYSLTTSLARASGNAILMNPGASDPVTAEANAFNWIGRMRDWTRSVNPSDGTSDFLAAANVNLNDTCNAFYNGVSVNFYPAGGGCVNTSFSSVVLHEMGHWMNNRYASGNGPDGFGEGNADNFATYILDDPIVGQDFGGPGSHIRDGNNTRLFCGDANIGCYGQVHRDGEVLMGAIWKVRTRLKNALGTAAGGDVADLLFNAWMNAYDDTQIRTIIEDHWLTLDDDNGNVGDGTPHYPHIDGGFRDQGFPGVDLALVSYLSVTDLPNTESEAGPYTVNASIVANFNPPLRAVELRYRVDGGAFQTVAMASSGGSGYMADIPGQESPARVEYYLTAADDSGNVATFPGNAPSALLKFVVGREVVYYAETFESGTNGWTHRSNNGAQDDWQLSSQVGAGSGTFGKSGDPTRAFSGTNVWGNDLGPSGWNGAYQDDVDNSLVSPAIDLSRATNTILRFRRWVTVEAGIYDQTRALVNGVEVWRNPDGADLLDTSWQEVEVDISAIADGDSAARVEFNLRSDQSVVFGGWNVDDVEILTFAASSEPAPAAAFGADRTSGVAPLTVSFSDLSSGAVSSWSWSFGDGGRSTAQSPSHQYALPGTYTVALTVTGPGGSDTETAVDLITVATPPPVAGFGADRTSGRAPLSVQFTDTSSGAVTAWAWELGDGTRSTSANPSHVYTSSGAYTVRLTVTGPGGSDSETQTNLIVVAPPLVISGVTPSEIDLLIPGTAETVSITGTSFTASTVVEVDGAPVDAGSFTVVHDGLITLDMPQVALGTRTLTVRDGADSDDADVTVVLPATPKLQVGNGDPLNVLSSATGASLAVAGRPGTVHYVLYSTSNVPSTAAIVSLAIGNSFSELFIGTVESIPASGIVQLAGPLAVPIPIDVYVQSVVFGLGRPLPVSNLQSVHFEP